MRIKTLYDITLFMNLSQTVITVLHLKYSTSYGSKILIIYYYCYITFSLIN